jgi:hypothetical protein
MKWYAAIVPLLLSSCTAYSQQSKNIAYDCVMECSGYGWLGAVN